MSTPRRWAADRVWQEHADALKSLLDQLSAMKLCAGAGSGAVALRLLLCLLAAGAPQADLIRIDRVAAAWPVALSAGLLARVPRVLFVRPAGRTRPLTSLRPCSGVWRVKWRVRVFAARQHANRKRENAHHRVQPAAWRAHIAQRCASPFSMINGALRALCRLRHGARRAHSAEQP